MTDTASRIFITGASGFVGQALCKHLAVQGFDVTGSLRQAKTDSAALHDDSFHTVVTGPLGPETAWKRYLTGIDTVIHLAARVHVMKESAVDPLSEFRLVNTLGTEQLAREAVVAGVRRFIYVSTIKVNGECTVEKAFTEKDRAMPADPYATSKYEAENILHGIAAEAGIEVVIIRPPLVYGPGVKGNYLKLLRAINLGIPMPFGSCGNKRSLVYLENMTDLLTRCITHGQAAGQTFLISDDEDLSTPELVTRLAKALGKSPRLLSVPPVWLETAARFIGKQGIYDRLCGSLQLDIRHARETLQWNPPLSAEEGISRTARWFLDRGSQP